MNRAAVLLLLLFSTPSQAAEPALRQTLGKIIVIYPKGNSNQMVIEAAEKLIAGRNVYVGPDEIPVTVDDILSESKGVFYYSASIAEKQVDIKKGDPVYRERAKEVPLQVKIKESYTFEQKRKAEVTAVQGDRAMFNRGTLHEVHERDLYWIYDSSGRSKGLLEVRGIGDLQSSGKLYNALEDRKGDALTTRPGDRLVFAGQRKLFALGAAGGLRIGSEHAFGKNETSEGGGLLWNCMFHDGWGVEVLFGGYRRKLEAGRSIPIPSTSNHESDVTERKASYIMPIWLKKNFFFPKVVSPFLAAGFSFFTGSNRYQKIYGSSNPAERYVIDDTARKTTLAPVLGAGLELFPARFLRPRVDVRWFLGPRLTTGGDTFYTRSLFVSFGFFTAW